MNHLNNVDFLYPVQELSFTLSYPLHFTCLNVSLKQSRQIYGTTTVTTINVMVTLHAGTQQFSPALEASGSG
jgi:hypothetical protein